MQLFGCTHSPIRKLARLGTRGIGVSPNLDLLSSSHHNMTPAPLPAHSEAQANARFAVLVLVAGPIYLLDASDL